MVKKINLNWKHLNNQLSQKEILPKLKQHLLKIQLLFTHFSGSFLTERRLTLCTKKWKVSIHKPSHWETSSQERDRVPIPLAVKHPTEPSIFSHWGPKTPCFIKLIYINLYFGLFHKCSITESSHVYVWK